MHSTCLVHIRTCSIFLNKYLRPCKTAWSGFHCLLFLLFARGVQSCWLAPWQPLPVNFFPNCSKALQACAAAWSWRSLGGPGATRPWGHLFCPKSTSPGTRLHWDFLFMIVSIAGSITWLIFVQATNLLAPGRWGFSPSPSPDFSCVPHHLGSHVQSRGSLHALITNLWSSHSFTTTETPKSGTEREQICSWALPLLLARVIPGTTFCVWTHGRKALARWSQQCLYKS